MVSKLDLKRLNTAIDKEISDAVEKDGEAKHSLIKSKVTAEFSEVIKRISDELADRKIGDMVTSHLRNWTFIKKDGSRQLSLPGIPPTILERMPVLITVPPEEEGEETRHVSLKSATVGELRRFEKFIADMRDNINKTADAAGFIKRSVEGVDDDIRLIDALRHRGKYAA
ncbi:hypothetical protein Oant_0222 [Brucella anthropi ATCC 49188]|uniref:Uncharacterized protein n=2 Tax=Brucella anthropi TaxID=529 RepID=A6WVE9_BRUA4|nr:hypothetical protein Oant_0222 [Brucella anthropi ATCC 49188]SUA60217.1 Uncharacterised protein [Brucella anthropi]